MRLNKQELQAMLKNNQKIPEGWSIVLLKSLSSNGIMNGIFNNPTKVGRGIPLINVVDLYNDKIDFRNLSLLDVSEDELKRYEAILGDLLFTRSSLKLEGIAQCNIVPVLESKCVFDCHIMRIRPNDQLVVPYYLFAYCNTAMAKMQFMKLSKTTTMTTIDQDGLGQLKVLLPPLAEQEKIAEILGTWDEAIEKLSGLIEQKKLLKKGLMQKLLTGKVRLNGFTQPWNEVKLGEIFNIKKGQGLSKDVLDSKGVYKCILYGELYTKYSEVIKNTISRTNKNEKITSNIGDLLIPASTTTSGIDLANATALLESDVILGGDINILRSKKEISPVFFAYLLTHSYKFDIARLAQGITIVHLYAEFLKSMKVFVPIDTNEQKAIADVLSTADEEIDLLNQKLDALKEQKKGLMQQLLTGQTRVKVN